MPFAKLVRYNAWANSQLLAALQGLPTEELAQPSSGLHESIKATLDHLFNAEQMFLNGLSGASDSHLAERKLSDYIDAAPKLEAGYLRWLASLEGAALSDPYTPWQGLGSLQDALTELLLHSHQHRAEIASELGRRGLPTFGYEFTRYVFEVDPGMASRAHRASTE